MPGLDKIKKARQRKSSGGRSSPDRNRTCIKSLSVSWRIFYPL